MSRFILAMQKSIVSFACCLVIAPHQTNCIETVLFLVNVLPFHNCGALLFRYRSYFCVLLFSTTSSTEFLLLMIVSLIILILFLINSFSLKCLFVI